MEKGRAMRVLLAAGAAALVGLLALFALELADTQAKSKGDVRARVHERGVLAGALISSLFDTTVQQIPQDTRLYGGRTVSSARLDRDSAQAHDLYIAVLGAGGHPVIAASRGFTAQARADLTHSAALRLIRAGHPYGVGDALPYGRTGVVNLGVVFPSATGPRTLLTGFAPQALSSFLAGELRKVPGVPGSRSMLIDGTGTVIGAADQRLVGHPVGMPALTRALGGRSTLEYGGIFYSLVPIANTSWQIVIASPVGALFASVSGLRKWIPWIIFAAFAVAGALAIVFGRRTARATVQVHDANLRLAGLNRELASTNDALERRAAELARSNAELEQFASIASHDLQEPLRKVRTFTQAVATGEADNLTDKGRDYLARANLAAERMQRLIEDLLRFSRVSTHGRPFTRVSFAEITREVLDDLEQQVAEAGAAVHVGELPTVLGDALQLRQLMQNLLSNAIKFRREGVVPEITVDGSVDGGVARIVVADNGIGFEPQYSRRIFRVFERLHGRTSYPGTGIGLALCRKIAERHGGTVVAEAVPGEGATFTLTMPTEQREEVLVAGRLDATDPQPGTEPPPTRHEETPVAA